MQQVIIQQPDFSVDQCQQRLIEACPTTPGAIVSFTGLVRDYTKAAGLSKTIQVEAIELQHYAGMTESLIGNIIQSAQQRWQIDASLVIHRIGHLRASEQIVYVGTASAHREAAFNACQFIMDYLKTEATLWKKEFYTANRQRWLDCKREDAKALDKWSLNQEVVD